MTKNQLLKLLALGRTAMRTIEGNREVWRIRSADGCERLACGPAMALVIKAGLVWTHFPSGSGSAGINDAGNAEAIRLGLWRTFDESQEAFECFPNAVTAACYRLRAEEYREDGIIGPDTYAAAIAAVDAFAEQA